MANRMIITGWGLPEYAPAAALLLRCAFKCSAEVIGASQHYLPTALRLCADACSEVYVLGVGLSKIANIKAHLMKKDLQISEPGRNSVKAKDQKVAEIKEEPGKAAGPRLSV